MAVDAVLFNEMTGAPRTVSVNKNGALAPAAFVAVSVTVKVPATVGVPERSPVVVLITNPAGNPVALKLVGLFVAVIA